MTSTNSVNSADATLKAIAAEMMSKDKRFQGMSSYVSDIKWWWTHQIPRACAGHGFIFFNPDWFNLLDYEEQKTIMAHEIYHLVLEHLDRMEDKDPDTWNEATDYAINWGLKMDGFKVESQTGWGDGGGILLDQKHAGKGATQIYREILQKKKEGKDNGTKESAKMQPSKEQIEDMVKEALNQDEEGKPFNEQVQDNAEKAKKAQEDGTSINPYRFSENMPGGQNRLIVNDALRIEMKEKPYEEIFSKYMVEPLSGGKRTYMRPSRRPYSGSFRLKGKYPKAGRKNRLAHLAYCLDVSGSISQEQANQFLASAQTIKELLNPKLMTIMLWDTRVVFEKIFREDEKVNNIQINAGGSTNLGPVYRRLEQLNPEAVVIFTDLMVTIPPEPSWDTIWFATEKGCRNHHVHYGDLYVIPEK